MKYIIEIPDKDKSKYTLSDKLSIPIQVGNNEFTIGIDTGLKLTPYDESAAEQRGREEAWELIKAIGKMSDDDMVDCFGTRVIVNLSYTEAREMYEAWKKIKVGDEVAFHHNDGRPDTVVVVTHVGDDGFIDGMDGKGTLYADKNPKRWTKTGRHFPEVAEVLNKMRCSKTREGKNDSFIRNNTTTF